MKRFFVVLIVLIVSGSLAAYHRLALASEPDCTPPASPTLTQSSRLPFLVLEGAPFQRGMMHGKNFKEPMHRLIDLWKADVKRQYNVEPEQFIRQFMQKTNYLPAIRKWTPDVLDEIRGIAQGAEVDFETVFVSQFFDEYFAQGRSIATGRCSCLGIAKQGGEPTCIAQNNDLEVYRDGFQVVLHMKIEGGDLEILVHSNPGCIGWNGINNKGIAVCINTVGQLSNCRDGLPVNCVIRGLLMQKNEQDAIAFLRRVKHASGANYLIGGPNHVYSFECSTKKIARYRPNNQDQVVWHTNHPLVNDDYNEEYRLLKARGEKYPGEENSVARLQCLERRLTNKTAGTMLDVIKAALASKDSPVHPVCGSRGKSDGFFTFAATIMVLSSSPEFYVTFGPPDQAAYERFDFSPGVK